MHASKIQMMKSTESTLGINKNECIQFGIGFATGRKSFQKVLKAYLYNWKEARQQEKENINLHLLVAYDLKYSNTKSTDYTNLNQDIVDMIEQSYFIDRKSLLKNIEDLMQDKVISEKEITSFFGNGYAGKRNAILYTAIRNKIDYLVFLDDDEYPMAVTKNHSAVLWSGQHILTNHLKFIKEADITNGYHCGYISPIPNVNFDNTLSESDFRLFIEAISNDIVNWNSIRNIMKNGGVTYADTNILVNELAEEVAEVNHCKFITGANLCINLTNPNKVLPFYNPPGARGEDTFLSTCLNSHKVIRIPCYAFHDGFSAYNHLLDGVLPTTLGHISTNSEKIVNRFYHACIGWIRYKPLLLYITQREHYEDKIREVEEKLAVTLPKICAYFNRSDFMKISSELALYSRNVKKHYKHFLDTQAIWTRILEYLKTTNKC
ncbi:hypothetical protein Psch_01487 [Pelotomaculum schinkii]|uniref:Uncharacterized protein n=2 Tax=Pelotomaculum schinkii TaxID=78350 RepID=A0A4Y7RGV6_9FIRM|nr:hypothetical protein Psch_01487 [Pelotomaculum schinkii]